MLFLNELPLITAHRDIETDTFMKPSLQVIQIVHDIISVCSIIKLVLIMTDYGCIPYRGRFFLYNTFLT